MNIKNLAGSSKDEIVKEMSKTPSYREEANALVHQSLRAGFIEELHAGRKSEILEDKSYSRITNEEMKKLMIETSSKLAEFLILKETNPEKYYQLINTITLMYTHDWETKKEI